MIRKALFVSALMAGALMGTAPAQASVSLAASSGLINLLHNSSIFTANNMQFSICDNSGACQTVFTGLEGLHNLSDLNAINSWANTGQYAGMGSPWDNYHFTFSATTSFFGNSTQQVQAPATPPIPEAATWAMMIAGFAVVGIAMRRRSKAATISFG